VKRPVKPAPIATTTRPEASAATLVSALAVTTGDRNPGTNTRTPCPIRELRSAARAKVKNTSS
jgi:hypothetical protein